MIVREFLQDPHISFDYFNDFNDTIAWLEGFVDPLTPEAKQQLDHAIQMLRDGNDAWWKQRKHSSSSRVAKSSTENTHDLMFEKFLGKHNSKDLMTVASEELTRRGSIDTFDATDYGIMGHVIKQILIHEPNQVRPWSVLDDDVLVGRLMEYFDFDKFTLPPRPLVREIIALQRRLLTLIEKYDLDKHATSYLSVKRILDFAEKLESPKDAYALLDDQIDELLG
jgi:hypothetical protein